MTHLPPRYQVHEHGLNLPVEYVCHPGRSSASRCHYVAPAAPMPYQVLLWPTQ